VDEVKQTAEVAAQKAWAEPRDDPRNPPRKREVTMSQELKTPPRGSGPTRALRWAVWLAVATVLASPGPLAEAEEARKGLTELSLDELLSIEVTSVSKRPERFVEAPAAIYVITQEDIRRSGVTSIPEALRLAPGVHVARVNSNTWAIGIRGFTSALSRALLVLIDGRAVYSPLFAGVFWDVQDVLLEDIERIEVIRGPGGTLWGANAVNGVINIITKHARATQGGLVTGGGGTEERGFGGFRYGGTIGSNFHYRVYGKAFDRDSGFRPDGSEFDDWRMARGGFRADWEPTLQDALTLQGDVYGGRAGRRTTITRLSPPSVETVERDGDLSGGNVLARWHRVLDPTSDLTLQAYYDRTNRRDPSFREDRDTFDLDFQHRFSPFRRHQVTWGLGYRLTSGDADAVVETVTFTPATRTDHLFSAFVQDEIVVVANLLRLTLGSKFEHNDYSGFEVQPSARLSWTPAPRHTVWAAVSRAVRTPSRVEHDLGVTTLVTTARPTFITITGNEGFDSEEVLASELGYRVQPADRLFVDLAAFYNRYDNLLSVEPGRPVVSASRTAIPTSLGNGFRADGYGAEVALEWLPVAWWRLGAAYAYLELDLEKKAGSTDPATASTTEGSSPHHQVSVRSFINLPGNFELDLVLRHVSRLAAQRVGAYTNLDARLGWRPTRNLEVSVVGQNLLEPEHREFGGVTSSEVQRGVYGKVTLQW
jgi:iron complex outermembrane receptor protein